MCWRRRLRPELPLEMIGTNDTEVFRLDQLGVPAHRRQQFGNSLAIDPFEAEELCEDWCEQPTSASTLRWMAVPDSPRNSAMNSRTVPRSPRSRFLATWAARHREARPLYQCAEVGSLGLHLTQAGSVAATSTNGLPSQLPRNVKCGLTQGIGLGEVSGIERGNNPIPIASAI